LIFSMQDCLRLFRLGINDRLCVGASLMSEEIQKMTQEIQRRISELAYLMWESAGRQHGMAMEYWLAAEREVLATMQAAAERMMPPERATNAKAKEQPKGEAKAAAKPAAAAPEPAKPAAPPPPPKAAAAAPEPAKPAAPPPPAAAAPAKAPAAKAATRPKKG
jgi:hypothetical protein